MTEASRLRHAQGVTTTCQGRQ